MLIILCNPQNTKIALLLRAAVSRSHTVDRIIYAPRDMYTTGQKIKVTNKENVVINSILLFVRNVCAS